MTQGLRARLVERATELGFARVGFARAAELAPEGQRLRTWLAEGRHGTMGWMSDTAAVRIDPRSEGMLPSAVSVVVLVTPYRTGRRTRGPSPARVAQYAWGRDYHRFLHKRMRKLASLLRDEGHAVRASVDSLPVFERAWAQRAGVGFIGKNACLIVPGLGSHVFLSTLVTSADFSADEPMAERCGRCRACLDACPTQAFVEPRVLDARRCISYATIEHRGTIEEDLRSSIHDWIFGCDACQDVCPFNQGRGEPDRECGDDPSGPAAVPWAEHEAEAFLTFTEEEFREAVRGTPLRRPGRAGMARNAALVLGNVGRGKHLPVLQHTADVHPEAAVREAARWGAARLRARLATTSSTSSPRVPAAAPPSPRASRKKKP